MQARKTDSSTDAESRIAPDPLAAVLPALAALGSIASIATILWAGRESDPSRIRRRPLTSLRELEADCDQLIEIFKRLMRALKMFGGDRMVSSSSFKFGVQGLKITPNAVVWHQSLVADIGKVLASSSRSSFEVMCAIEDGAIDAPETVFYGFGECQERLNKLLQERSNLKGSVESGLAIAEELARLVQELKRHKKD